VNGPFEGHADFFAAATERIDELIVPTISI